MEENKKEEKIASLVFQSDGGDDKDKKIKTLKIILVAVAGVLLVAVGLGILYFVNQKIAKERETTQKLQNELSQIKSRLNDPGTNSSSASKQTVDDAPDDYAQGIGTTEKNVPEGHVMTSGFFKGSSIPGADWKTYKSPLFGWSFKYPPDATVKENCEEMTCVDIKQGGKWITFRMDVIDQTWPWIDIIHDENAFFNPPSGTDLLAWLKKYNVESDENIPKDYNFYFTGKNGHPIAAVAVDTPFSVGAGAQRNIYYVWDGKLFDIRLNESDRPDAMEYYSAWLQGFSVSGSE